MVARTTMLHVRVDEEVEIEATEKLAECGLTVSDAVRIFLESVAKGDGPTASLTADPKGHDAWFRAKVQEAFDDVRPMLSQSQVMDEAQALIEHKRLGRSTA